MSLKELIEQLQNLAYDYPELLDQPVWLEVSPPEESIECNCGIVNTVFVDGLRKEVILGVV